MKLFSATRNFLLSLKSFMFFFLKTSNASVVSYSRSMCQVCDEIDKILRLYNITVYTFELDTMEKGQEMYDLLQQQTGTKEMPQVFVCGRFVGGKQNT